MTGHVTENEHCRECGAEGPGTRVRCDECRADLVALLHGNRLGRLTAELLGDYGLHLDPGSYAHKAAVSSLRILRSDMVEWDALCRAGAP